MKYINMVVLFSKMLNFHENPVRVEHKRKQITLQAYKNKMHVLTLFLSERKQIKIKSEKFTKTIAYDYFDWLLGKYNHNYSVRCVEICQTVLKFGISQQITNKNNLIGLKLKRKPPVEPTYFTPGQIALWENYNTSDEKKQKAAHLAVLQMHTGFDYGDFSQIGRLNITCYNNRRFIQKPRQKNGNQAIIPLTNKAEAILEFYDYKMKLLSNPSYNKLMKEVASDIGLSLYINSKALRKVFAMDQLNNKGVSIATLSKILGHSKIKTTEETYAKVNINLISNELDRLGM